EGVFKTKRFLEKPNRQKAEKLIHSRNLYWNSGIFVWTLGAISDAFAQFVPADWEILQGARTEADLVRAYAEVTEAPIDIAVLENASNVYVLPADIGWNDIGSWGALYDLQEKNP